jgi:hypothetical protein
MSDDNAAGERVAAMIEGALKGAEVQLVDAPGPAAPLGIGEWYSEASIRRLVQPFGPAGAERIRVALLDNIRDLRAKLAQLKIAGSRVRPWLPRGYDDWAVVHFQIGVFPFVAVAHADHRYDSASEVSDEVISSTIVPGDIDCWWELIVGLLVEDDALQE